MRPVCFPRFENSPAGKIRIGRARKNPWLRRVFLLGGMHRQFSLAANIQLTSDAPRILFSRQCHSACRVRFASSPSPSLWRSSAKIVRANPRIWTGATPKWTCCRNSVGESVYLSAGVASAPVLYLSAMPSRCRVMTVVRKNSMKRGTFQKCINARRFASWFVRDS